MDETENSSLVCSDCESSVEPDDDFCTYCGTIFTENLCCVNHTDAPAKGVCVLCCKPFCEKCGTRINDRFLCSLHDAYEIYQGMARVYGALNDTAVQYAGSRLEQAGFHPVLFCRHQPKGGPRFVYTLFGAEGDYLGNIVNEIKVMVPLQEVLKAEAVLKSLGITS